MHRLRHGDHGPAVAEIRGTLAGLGFLDNGIADTRCEGTNGSHWIATDAVFDHTSTAPYGPSSSSAGFSSTASSVLPPTASLKEASYRLGARTLIYQLSAPLYGDDVATLQTRLQDLGFYVGRVDGYFGPQHPRFAVLVPARDRDLAADGICGPDTLRSLELLGTRVTGGSPHAMSEEEMVRTAPAPAHRQADRHRSRASAATPRHHRAGRVRHDLRSRRSCGISPAASRAAWPPPAWRRSCPARGTPTPRTSNAPPPSNGFDADLMISLRCEQRQPVRQRCRRASTSATRTARRR